MKIAACVILYHPDASVEHNIISYINAVEKIYIADNSETNQNSLEFLSAHSSKTVFINDGNNDGIAKRLNQLCSLAIEDGFDFLLTMDQDSYFENLTFEDYIEYVTNYTNEIKVAMFGVSYQEQLSENGCNYNSVKNLITSGSIINLSAYKQIGSFDEGLFIDFVDTDYCFKSLIKGYTLIQVNNVFMRHKIGTITQKHSLKNLKLTQRSIHSSIRLYYMVRNYLYMSKKYKNDFKTELLLFKKDIQNRIKNKLLYSKNRLQTIKNVITAWKDFKQLKMGKKY